MLEFPVRGGGLADVHGHDHGEGPLENGLGDVQNVDVIARQTVADGGDDAHLVLAQDGNNSVHG